MPGTSWRHAVISGRTYKTAATAAAADRDAVSFPTRIAVVVLDDLPVWQRLNVCAFLVNGVAAAVPELIGDPYQDADGTKYLAMFGRPVLVFEAPAQVLTAAHGRLSAPSPETGSTSWGSRCTALATPSTRWSGVRGCTPRLVHVHVCFVCSGNICRSPVAALVLTGHLRRAGLADRVRVTSAGIGPWHVGEPADPRARRVLSEHGYPTNHVAAQVNEDHLSADLLLAMDAGHEAALRDLLKHQGDSDERLVMFRSFDPNASGQDVPDPYYGEFTSFVEVFGLVEAAMPGLVEWIRAHLD